MLLLYTTPTTETKQQQINNSASNTLLSSVLEFVKDIARNESFNSPAREITVVGELLQKVQCVDNICRQFQWLVPMHRKVH